MNIVIVQPTLNSVTETFIRAHAAYLPASTTVLHGYPVHRGERPVLPSSIVWRGLRKLDRVLRNKNSSWEMTRSLLRAFAQVKPKVVLAEYGTTGVAVREACQLTGIPLVVHFHGFDASNTEVLAANRVTYPQMFDTAAAVVAVSRKMESRLWNLGASKEKVHHVPYGVNSSFFEGANPALAAPLFVAVGRLVEKKAPHLTLMAFSKVFKKVPTAQLRIIGDGPLSGVCKDLARVLGIDNAVTFMGAQPPEVVRQNLKMARAFVQHSVEASNGDCEGTPVAILEAGVSGLPVISTRHAGIPDVVLEGETGLLVEERDMEGMAEQMIRLCVDAQLAGQLGVAARRHIGEHYSMDKSIKQLWKVLCATFQ